MLKNIISNNKVSIIFSELNIEEILCLWKHDEKLARDQIKLLMELVDLEKMLHPITFLIKNEINKFLNLPFHSLPFFVNKMVLRNLDTFINNLSLNNHLVNEINEISSTSKLLFHNEMLIAKKETTKIAKKLNSNNIKLPTFDQFKNLIRQDFLKSILIKLRKYNKCKRKGFINLFKEKLFKIYIDSSIALIYSQIFEKKTPNFGDGTDLKHLIASTFADIFVTDDNQLFSIIQKNHFDNFKVMKLVDFIKAIKTNSLHLF